MIKAAKARIPILSLILIGLLAHGKLHSAVICGSTELEKEMVAMLDSDQSIRAKYGEKLNLASSKGKEVSEKDRNEFAEDVGKVDKYNQVKLDEIVRQCGWPRGNIFFNTSLNAAFMIVQHGDLAYQEKYSSHIRDAYERGEIPKFVFAIYEDRVLIRQGKPQRYGTQYTIGSDGLKKLGAVEDPDRLNERRISIGLTVVPGYP